MTVSSCLTSASGSCTLATQVYVDYELVRGSEQQLIENLLPQVRQESVALNLSSVERIDAAGIAALISLYCSAVQAGTDFSVVEPSARVLDLLELVGLHSILTGGDRLAGESGCPLGRSAA